MESNPVLHWTDHAGERQAMPLKKMKEEFNAFLAWRAQQPAAPVAPAEPVAYWIPKAEQFCIAKAGERPFAKAWEPLYTAPPPAKGLTDAQIRAICQQFGYHAFTQQGHFDFIGYARAVLAAAGIPAQEGWHAQ